MRGEQQTVPADETDAATGRMPMVGTADDGTNHAIGEGSLPSRTMDAA